MTPALTLVTDAPETPAQAAARLQREASQQASAAITNMRCMMDTLAIMAGEISELIAAPAGAREVARQLNVDLIAKADTIMAILGRGR